MIKTHSIMDGSLCIHILFLVSSSGADMSDSSEALALAGITLNDVRPEL